MVYLQPWVQRLGVVIDGWGTSPATPRPAPVRQPPLRECAWPPTPSGATPTATARRAPSSLIVAFGKLAEVCGSYCVKGRRIYIEGRLRSRDYDGQDGLRRHTTEIVAEVMKLLDRRHGDDESQTSDPDPLTIASEPATAVETGNGRRGRAVAV